MERFTRLFVYITAFLLPVIAPLGAVWARMLCIALLCLVASVVVWQKRSDEQLRIGIAGWLAVAVATICVIQLIPLPVDSATWATSFSVYVQGLAGVSEPTSTITLDPYTTRTIIVWMAGLFSLSLILESRAFAYPAYRSQLLRVLGFSALFQAALGALSVLSGAEWGPFLADKVHYIGNATGTFVNRNQFAAYVNLGLVASLILFLRAKSPGPVASRLDERILWRLIPVVLVIGLTMSHSRAGAIGFMLVMAVMLLTLVVRQVKQPQKKGGLKVIVLVASIVVFDGLVVSNWFGLDYLKQRIEQTSVDRDHRDEVWADVVHAIETEPQIRWVGAGLGSFEATYPIVKRQYVQGRYNFAHSDILELVYGVGIAGVSILLLTLIVALLWGRKQGRRWDALGVALVLMAIAPHLIVDFSYASWSMLATLVILTAALSSERKYIHFHKIKPRRAPPSMHPATTRGGLR